MKKLIIASTALALTTTAHASWFGPSQEVIDLRNQVTQQQSAAHFWIIVAGVLALCIIIAFIVGTVLGSKVRRHAKESNPGE
jgi:formate-dependent nitrite reductase membrane component NrfD